MKTMFRMLAIMATLSFFWGCTLPTSEPTTINKLGKIDIVGARALMVSPRTSIIGSRAASSTNVLTKISSDGTISEVTLNDTEGNVATNQVPEHIYDVNASFVIIVFSSTPYLVNKTNGIAYDLTAAGSPTQLSTDSGLSGQNRKSIYTDNLGSIYYLSSGIVKKIDVSNPSSLTVQNYTPDVDAVEEFAVSQNGDVIYKAYGVKRIKKSNGGLFNLQNNGFAFWIGNDGKIYDIQSTSYGGSSDGIKRIDIDSSFNVSIVDFSAIAPTTYQGYQYHYLYLENRIIGICDISYEFENPSQTPRVLSFPFLSYSIRKIVAASKNYWYVATKDGQINRVNPTNDEVTTYLNTGDYDFYKMSVTSDDKIYFNALRMSDGKKVLGEISSDGTVNIIDDTLTENILILQPIN